MEGCFMFQWRGGVFRWGEGFIFNVGGGCPMVGASVLVGGFSEKNRKMGDAPMPPTPHCGKPLIKTYKELLGTCIT